MFNTEFNFYALIIIISLILNIILILRLIKNYKYISIEKIGLLIYETIGIIYGAKLFSIIVNYDKYSKNFNFSYIGFSAYGAVVGIILMLFLFAFQFNKSYKELLYIHIPSIPLMYAIGKVGCFISGCCYGIEYKGVGSIKYFYSHSAPLGINLFPIQIIETVIFFIIFLYLYNRVKKEEPNKKVISLAFVLCGISKFSLDFFRASHVGINLSINQIVSIIFIILGIIMIIPNFLLQNKKIINRLKLFKLY